MIAVRSLHVATYMFIRYHVARYPCISTYASETVRKE